MPEIVSVAPSDFGTRYLGHAAVNPQSDLVLLHTVEIYMAAVLGLTVHGKRPDLSERCPQLNVIIDMFTLPSVSIRRAYKTDRPHSRSLQGQ